MKEKHSKVSKHGTVVTIDRENMILYITINDGAEHDHTDASQYDPHGVIYDLDKNDKIIGVEILL